MSPYCNPPLPVYRSHPIWLRPNTSNMVQLYYRNRFYPPKAEQKWNRVVQFDLLISCNSKKKKNNNNKGAYNKFYFLLHSSGDSWSDLENNTIQMDWNGLLPTLFTAYGKKYTWIAEQNFTGFILLLFMLNSTIEMFMYEFIVYHKGYDDIWCICSNIIVHYTTAFVFMHMLFAANIIVFIWFLQI